MNNTDYTIQTNARSWSLEKKQNNIQKEYSAADIPVKDPTNLIKKKINYIQQIIDLKKIQAGFINFPTTNAIISNPISIDNARYIMLNVKTSPLKNANIEYSIIDGNTEKPILPEEEKMIVDEKIFYKLPTRFRIDVTKNVVIKKNGIVMPDLKELSEVEKMFNGIDQYTVSYTPVDNSDRVTIENTVIKLKMVIRVYKNGVPPTFFSLCIKQFGGVIQWI